MRKYHSFRCYVTALICGIFACLPAIGRPINYGENSKVTFNPSTSTAGLNVGAQASDPSTLVNGDVWYQTGIGIRARVEGATITLGTGGSGSSAGLISITNDSGTTSSYNPASDTDAARGTALLTAVAAATAGQTVRVGAGTFALSKSRLLIPDDVSLDLDPATLITGTANLSVDGPMVRPGNRSVVRGGKIQGVAASGVSQAPFGISSFVASPDPRTVDFVLDGVTLEADSDAFYILSNEACSGIIRNCDLISKYDIIYVSGYNGDPASHVVQIYNTRGVVVGPSSIASPVARGTTIAYGATVDIHGGSISVSDGGATLNAGVAVYADGILNLYGVPITASNGVNPNYDLYTNGTGIINVNGGVGSDTDGVFIVSGGANVKYIAGSVAASGSFDATAVDAVTWSDGANASNIWTFNVSGTDPTLTAGSNNFIFGSGSIDLGSAGVRLSQDGDGAVTFLGLGNGSNEDLTLNFDDTSNSIVASSSTGAGLDLSGLAAVNIGTLQGTEGSHLHVIYSSVGSGTAYTMTAAYAAVDMGTTDPSVTIAATGTYRIYANIQVSFSGASYAALDEATFKLRRTNNTAADLTDGERGTFLPIMTTTTRTGPSVTIGPIEYTTTNTNDVIVIQGDLNATPSAGTITVTKATIFAERVRQ